MDFIDTLIKIFRIIIFFYAVLSTITFIDNIVEKIVSKDKLSNSSLITQIGISWTIIYALS